ncbi:MAG: DNA internalization-related competence protein ComEC/Rec2 [Acidobacteriota bacterium]
MTRRSIPAVFPALGFTCGSALALLAPFASVPLLVALLGSGLALGGEAGGVIAFAAVGALNTVVRWVGPERVETPLDSTRPLEAEIRVGGYAVRSSFGWSVPIEVERWRQGGEVGVCARDATLSLPDSVPPPVRGERLRASGYLRPGSQFANDPPVSFGGWRLAVKTRALLRPSEPAPLWLGPAAAAREMLDRATLSPGAHDRAAMALVRALLVGDTSGIPDAWRRGLKRTGLLHLLAVSGFNVSLLVAVVWFACSWWSRTARLVASGSVLVLYVLVVGPLASVLRAGVMGGLFLGALSLRRPPVAANALAVSTIALLVLDPRLVADLGFHLTFAATAGLVFLSPLLVRWWAWMPKILARPLAVTWAAQLATLPWALVVFRQIHPAAFLFNLLFVPLTAVAMVVDLFWVMLAVVVPAWGRALEWIPSMLAVPFHGLTHLPAGGWLVWPLDTRDAGWVLFVIVSWTLLARAWRPLLLGSLALVALLAALQHVDTGGLEVHFLDVGQGDATLFRGGRHAVLVDGGGWAHGDFGGTVLLPALARAGIRRLDAMVMTHPDIDHCRGLVDLADYVAVDELWLTASAVGSPCARDLLGRARLRPRLLSAGDRARAAGWEFRILSPQRLPAQVGPPTSDNNGSMVLLVSAPGRSVLVTGDIEARAEARLEAELGSELAADILKVAHHGSRTSSLETFLRAVAPRLAVVSAGAGNRFGHPDPTVIGRFAERRIPLLRTDRDGQVSLRRNSSGRWSLRLPGAPRND